MSPKAARGALAPAFEAVDQLGARVASDELRQRWVVLYFYPRDGTTGCTREACGFRDEFALLRAEGAEVIGISRDSTESHQRFAQRNRLPFRLLSDPDGSIHRAYGASGILGLPRRVTFLIGPDGRIAKRYRVLAWRKHAANVLRDLRALKRDKQASSPTKSKTL